MVQSVSDSRSLTKSLSLPRESQSFHLTQRHTHLSSISQYSLTLHFFFPKASNLCSLSNHAKFPAFCFISSDTRMQKGETFNFLKCSEASGIFSRLCNLSITQPTAAYFFHLMHNWNHTHSPISFRTDMYREESINFPSVPKLQEYFQDFLISQSHSQQRRLLLHTHIISIFFPFLSNRHVQKSFNFPRVPKLLSRLSNQSTTQSTAYFPIPCTFETMHILFFFFFFFSSKTHTEKRAIWFS